MLDKVFGDVAKLSDETEITGLRAEFETLAKEKTPGSDPKWKSLYLKACELRRIKRLAPLLDKYPKLLYTKHYVLGGSHYAYTEEPTDAQKPERNNDRRMGAQLCMMEITPDGKVLSEVLHETKTGVLRDPDVSYDAKRILFSMRENDKTDDFHIYEYDLETKKVKQLTDGLGFADIEPCYIPDGNIIFASTRCMQIVDCWWTDVCNFYIMDGEGRFMRRIGFDQVHTNYPTMTEDGRILYTRWDYNDRGQLYPQPLFQMNYDGTGQTEFYGNNSWFPTTIMHAREIPGSQKVVALASGHHSHQRGKLILIDRSKGTQEADGVTLICPPRETKAEIVDAYGQHGEQFQYPYPLDEEHFLVTYCPEGYSGARVEGKYDPPFGIYFTDIEGNRELLAFDPSISCNQQVPIAERPIPMLRTSVVDHAQDTGTYFVQDIYEGPGLKGVEPGTVKSIRIVALDFRAAGIQSNGNRGPGGGALVSTPVSYDNGSWDVKRVLGKVPVEEDGSAYFQVPAKTPLYFQMLDEKGYTVQTMRSWSTLQPGEMFSCIGCHENKNEILMNKNPQMKMALKRGARIPEPLIDADRGFSFVKDVQPILDANCTKCHTGSENGQKLPDGTDAPFSLLGKPYQPKEGEHYKPAGRSFSEAYINLVQKGKPNEIVNWLNVQSIPPMIPPRHSGALKSKLIKQLEDGHKDVKLSPKEMEVLACWIDLSVPYCGSYTESNTWTDAEKAEYAYYQNKRDRMKEIENENIKRLIEYKDAEMMGEEPELPAPASFPVFDAGGREAKVKFIQNYLQNMGK